MNRSPLRLALPFGALLLAAACAPAAERSASTPGFGPAATERAVVEVENRNWSDVTVYAVRPRGSRIRLGTVTSMTTEAFTLPARYLGAEGEVMLLAEPVGSTDVFRSQPVQVFAGQRVAFTVQNHLPISSLAVRTQ